MLVRLLVAWTSLYTVAAVWAAVSSFVEEGDQGWVPVLLVGLVAAPVVWVLSLLSAHLATRHIRWDLRARVASLASSGSGERIVWIAFFTLGGFWVVTQRSGHLASDDARALVVFLAAVQHLALPFLLGGEAVKRKERLGEGSA